MTPGSPVLPLLPRSMALAARLLARGGSARSFADDPLRLDLPALGPSGAGAQIDRSTLETLAALYLQAELEDAAVIPVAEALADEAGTLQVRDTDAAVKLDDFAAKMRSGWYDRRRRAAIFARVFGMGAASTEEPPGLVNDSFPTQLATFAQAIVGIENEASWQGRLGGRATAHLELAAQGLLDSLGRRAFANALIAARTIQEQLAAALAILGHKGVMPLFRARTAWDVIRNILGPDTPDLARIVGRGQSGLRLLGWLAANLGAVGQPGALAQALQATPSVSVWAGSWLAHSGLDRPQPGLNPYGGGGGYGLAP
jgi:hypothetical protein